MVQGGRHVTQLEAARGHLARKEFEAAERTCRRVLRGRPRDMEGLCLLASILVRTGRVPEAIRTLSRVIELYPKAPAGYVELARIHVRAGRAREAERVLGMAEKRVTDRPGDVLVERSRLLAHGGAYVRSLELLRRAVEVDPENAEAWFTLGHATLSNGDAAGATAALARAVALDGTHVEAICLLGHALRMTEDLAGAREQFDLALRIDPSCVEAIAGQAEVLQSEREYDAAAALIEQALNAGAAHHPYVALAYARWCQWAGQYERGAAVVQSCLDQKHGVGKHQRLMLFFAAGGLYEGMQEYDKAFRCYRAGNELYPKRFDREAHAGSTDELMQAFSAATLRARRGHCGCQDATPVFILGMPRSGTSLVEQVIARHPKAVGCGELTILPGFISDLRARLPEGATYPACLGAMTDEELTGMGDKYVEQLRRAAGSDALRATDKLPANYFHIGLINLILPNARIIHCQRHPMDTCFSIYATQLSPLHAYANDQIDLSVAYREYHRLMEHWQQVSYIPILSVRYEAMVDNLEAQARKIMDHLEIEWDDACLRFHEAKRVVGTASEDQVRRPIYRSSVERYRHFEAHLVRLREGLGDLVEAYEAG